MTVVVVIAKAPVPGFAKTRLCPPATPHEAAQIAAAALLDTIDAVAATPGIEPVLAHTGWGGDVERAGEISAAYNGRGGAVERAGEIRTALTGWRLVPQRGTTFAARLAHAMADAGRGGPVLLIGMDTPQVRPDLLALAAAALSTVDAVLGPATDGGWWALGLRDPESARVLPGVPMSTPDTGRLTRAALRAIRLRVADLPVLSDVDTWDAAVKVADAIPASRFAAAVRVGADR